MVSLKAVDRCNYSPGGTLSAEKIVTLRIVRLADGEDKLRLVAGDRENYDDIILKMSVTGFRCIKLKATDTKQLRICFQGIERYGGRDIRTDRQNKDFTLRADFCRELKIDQSIAHNGVCLTVVDIRDDTYTVTAMKEDALDRWSNPGLLAVGGSGELPNAR